MSDVVHAWRWRAGVRSLVRRPPSLDGARARIREAVATRDQRFLASMRQLVWSVPSSPYVPLLRHAGIEGGDLGELVRAEGLEGALGTLRDAGVYVSHEEWLGKQALRRGSMELTLEPAAFVNPRLRSLFFGHSGGTRTGGVPVQWSFATLRRGVDPYLLRASSWDVAGTPAAIWLPAQPSAVGIATALTLAAAGEPPERWFTPVRAARHKPARVAASNLLLPVVLRSAGVRLPRPRYAPLGEPRAVLEWCREALERAGRARLGAYTSSAVRLAELARADGVPLEGMVIATLGEPLGRERAAAIRASGASPANGYGFMQKGTVAHACPSCGDDDLHLLESDVAVIARKRPRPDGRTVPAFLWTSLHEETPSVLINVENDDYGRIDLDAEACGCELGAAGVRRRISAIRGMTKVTAEGMTVPAEILERLVESVLPRKLGGTPADYQFVHRGEGRDAGLVLRIDPRLGAIDGAAVAAAVEGELRTTPAGLLAADVWSQAGTLRPLRVQPEATASGKVLPLSVA